MATTIPHVSIYLDKSRPKTNGKSSVKIKVTFNRKRKYYSCGIDLTSSEFEQILFGKKRTMDQKDIKVKLEYFEKRAIDVIKALPIFSIDAFENAFLSDRNHYNSVAKAYSNYIEELKSENRLGTASNYQCSINSLENFQSNLTFADITPNFLKRYERWMLDNGNSISTVGIYLRPLKSIFNQQNIESIAYPFGSGKSKYTIPASKNTKKALNSSDISRIYHYPIEEGSRAEQARDYWIFLFLSNGMNVKDFCSLRWSQINGDILVYNRAKTITNKRTRETIKVSLKSQTHDIIAKWGTSSENTNDYIFPHFHVGMSEEEKRKVHQQLTKTINKYMKRIGIDLGLNVELTTYVARHSFATHLKNDGANIEMISELLGHSSVRTTSSYLDSFENEQIHSVTESLSSIFQK